MRRYSCLIIDADHTLLNYLADERNAFCSLYEKLGMEVGKELLALSRHSSENAWIEAGLYNVTEPSVQKAYHTLYRTHTEEIFCRIFAQFPCKTCSAKEAGLRFLEELKRVGTPLGNALETVKALSRKGEGGCAIYIATNGLSDMQHTRLEKFLPWVEGIVVSEDVQSVKPAKAFFETLLRETGYAVQDCLMVGDSLISDIGGAKALGMDTCWFNPARRENTTGIVPDYEIERIEELWNVV